MAVAVRAVPRTTAPVLVTRLVEGTDWMISWARSAGGVGSVAMERLVIFKKLVGRSSGCNVGIRLHTFGCMEARLPPSDGQGPL
jgi:hypothetical protein